MHKQLLDEVFPRFNVWVNRQGTYVHREYNNSSMNGIININTRVTVMV